MASCDMEEGEGTGGGDWGRAGEGCEEKTVVLN